MDNDNEEFNVNEEDIARAYNPYAFRRKQTKDQAALGIWADSDSDEERVGLGAKTTRGGRRGVDLSQPVQFISAGFTGAGSKDKEPARKAKRTEAEQSEAAEDEEAQESDEDEDLPAPFDFSRPRRGVVDLTAEDEEEETPSQPTRVPPSSRGRGGLGTASSTLRGGLGPSSSSMRGARGARFGGRGGGPPPAAHAVLREFGTWERHTKGIGRKLLEKMGFEYGKGLGSKQQGIALPVQAFQRRGRGALGFHGSERADQTLFVEDADAPSPQASASAASAAQKSAKPAGKAYKKTAQRRENTELYLTADELIKMNPSRGGLGVPIVAAEPSAGGVLSSVKVIDMRGPEQRVYSGYSAMAAKITSDTVPAGRAHRGAVGDSDEEPEASRKRNFELPKLEHNLNLLVELSEQEILHNHKMLREHQLRLESLHSEQDQLISRCDEDKKLLPRLDALDQLVADIEKMAVESEDANGTSGAAAVADAQRQAAIKSSLDRCLALVRHLRTEFAAECSLLELDQLAPLLFTPIVKKLFAKWKPLIEPTFGLAEMRRIRRGFDSLNESTDQSAESLSQTRQRDETLFTQLLSSAWLPIIEGVVQRWNTRNPDPLINLIDAWCVHPAPRAGAGAGAGAPRASAGASAAFAIDVDVDGMEEEGAYSAYSVALDAEPLMPPSVRAYVLEQCVLRRLQGEVLAWDPLIDTVPIHCWIHPWLPLLKDQLNVLYPTIRTKIGMALDGQASARAWHPSDPSARGLLEPWTGVWPRGETQAFLARHIVPKLLACMQHELVIDPSRPIGDASQAPQLEHLFSWTGLMPTANVLHILDQAFFPKWLGVLRIWLDSPSVDLDEVARWYLRWKQCFPADLLQIQSVQDYLGQALHLMNAASSKSAGGPRVAAPPPPPPPPESASASESGVVRVRGVESSASAAANVRELVERLAAQQGIEFSPLVAAGGSLGAHPAAIGVAAGKQLYRLGSLIIFIDRNVVFARLPGAAGSTSAQWTPLTVPNLFELASK